MKSTIYKNGNCYHCTVKNGDNLYKEDSFDFVAGYVIPEDVWYILPERLVRGMSSVGLYPSLVGAKYDPYKEAWYLLRGEKPGTVARMEACVEEPASSPRFSIRNRAGWIAPFVLAGRFLRWRLAASGSPFVL